MSPYHLSMTVKGHSRVQCPLTVIEMSTQLRAAASSTDVGMPLTRDGGRGHWPRKASVRHASLDAFEAEKAPDSKHTRGPNSQALKGLCVWPFQQGDFHTLDILFPILNFFIKHLWKYASQPISPSLRGACWPVSSSLGKRRLLEAGHGPGICRASGLTGSESSPPHLGPCSLCHPSGFS